MTTIEKKVRVFEGCTCPIAVCDEELVEQLKLDVLDGGRRWTSVHARRGECRMAFSERSIAPTIIKMLRSMGWELVDADGLPRT
jgi:hypothetical protein